LTKIFAGSSAGSCTEIGRQQAELCILPYGKDLRSADQIVARFLQVLVQFALPIKNRADIMRNR